MGGYGGHRSQWVKPAPQIVYNNYLLHFLKYSEYRYSHRFNLIVYSSVKPQDKRDGGGQYNWGSPTEGPGCVMQGYFVIQTAAISTFY